MYTMELGPEDVSLLERCPHCRRCYVQASMELGPEDVSLLERCPCFRDWNWESVTEMSSNSFDALWLLRTISVLFLKREIKVRCPYLPLPLHSLAL